MATPTQAFVYNHDIIGFYTRLNRFLIELLKSQSSGVSQLNAFDQARLKAYLANVRGYHAWVTAQPQLDLPETSPRQWPLDEAPTIEIVENEEVNDIVRMLVLARDELTGSQSARLSSGLIKFDSDRFTAMVTKVEAFLDTYVNPLTPLDLPESSPDAAMSGPGKTGV